MTREEHMDWCKKRVLAYCEPGQEFGQALTSMASDLGKHDETRGHSAIELGMMLLMAGQLSDAHKMREFINGFN